MSTCASFDRGDSGPDCARDEDGECGGGEQGAMASAFTLGASASVSEGVGGGGGGGRRDDGLRGRGKRLRVCRGEGDEDEDASWVGAPGRAKTPSSTSVGGGDATRLDRRLKSGAFASIMREAPGFVCLEYGMAVLDMDARRVWFDSEVVDTVLGSLTI